LQQCQGWRHKYPVVLPEYNSATESVNSYRFVDVLSAKLPADAVVVTDMGTAFTGTFQAAKMKAGQRWLTASGHAPMGYGLPGAVGAAFATGRKVICIVGDGAFQFNLQELQTIVHNKLPIIIFVLNNGGYLTIMHMQTNHFSAHVGSEPGSGVSFPDVSALAIAYKMRYYRLDDSALLEGDVSRAIFDRGPCIAEVIMPKDQPLIPRTSSKKMPDGSIKSAALEDMFPFLPRDEFNAQMIVPTVETLK
jgi:acetolactate synthase-1/2/3 large subunit